MDATMRRNVDAYEAMFEELVQKHAHEHVIFHDGKFVGGYPTFHEAAEEATRRFGSGPYLIREVGAPRSFPMPASVAYRPHYADR